MVRQASVICTLLGAINAYAYTGATPVGPGITTTCQTSQPGPAGKARYWTRCSDKATMYTDDANVDHVVPAPPVAGVIKGDIPVANGSGGFVMQVPGIDGECLISSAASSTGWITGVCGGGGGGGGTLPIDYANGLAGPQTIVEDATRKGIVIDAHGAIPTPSPIFSISDSTQSDPAGSPALTYLKMLPRFPGDTAGGGLQGWFSASFRHVISIWGGNHTTGSYDAEIRIEPALTNGLPAGVLIMKAQDAFASTQAGGSIYLIPGAGGHGIGGVDGCAILGAPGSENGSPIVPYIQNCAGQATIAAGGNGGGAGSAVIALTTDAPAHVGVHASRWTLDGDNIGGINLTQNATQILHANEEQFFYKQQNLTNSVGAVFDRLTNGSSGGLGPAIAEFRTGGVVRVSIQDDAVYGLRVYGHGGGTAIGPITAVLDASPGYGGFSLDAVTNLSGNYWTWLGNASSNAIFNASRNAWELQIFNNGHLVQGDTVGAEPSDNGFGAEFLGTVKIDGALTLGSSLTLTGNLLWASDGGGNIGASGANRPNQVFVKSFINLQGIVTGSAPSVSASGTMSEYYNTSIGAPVVSLNAGSYVPLLRTTSTSGLTAGQVPYADAATTLAASPIHINGVGVDYVNITGLHNTDFVFTAAAANGDSFGFFSATGAVQIGSVSNHPLQIFTNSGSQQVSFNTDFTMQWWPKTGSTAASGTMSIGYDNTLKIPVLSANNGSFGALHWTESGTKDVASSGAGAQTTTITSVTVGASGLFHVNAACSATTSDTVTVQLSYTDAVNTTAQTISLINAVVTGTNGTASGQYNARANTSTAVAVKITNSGQATTKCHATITPEI